jgi:ribosome-binding factor A
MTESLRARQLAKRIQEIAAEAVEFRVKDPDLGFVTITDARLTNDFREATVFYTVMGTEEEREKSGAALEKARGPIRSEVGKRLGLKHTPSIKFVVDAVPENALHLEELLREMRAKDAEVEALKQNATYAGDADPYKSDGDDED